MHYTEEVSINIYYYYFENYVYCIYIVIQIENLCEIKVNSNCVVFLFFPNILNSM